jgi:hypothetical protein
MIAVAPLLFDNVPDGDFRPCTQDGEGERLMLASIIRRAAFDIVLYRNSPRLVDRLVGVQAYQWMFKEDPDRQHPRDRFTSFLSICEILNQDPEWIRSQTLTLKKSDVKKYDRIR